MCLIRRLLLVITNLTDGEPTQPLTGTKRPFGWDRKGSSARTEKALRLGPKRLFGWDRKGPSAGTERALRLGLKGLFSWDRKGLIAGTKAPLGWDVRALWVPQKVITNPDGIIPCCFIIFKL